MSGECIMFFSFNEISFQWRAHISPTRNPVYRHIRIPIFFSDIFLHKYLHSCFCSLVLNTRSSWEVFLIMISFPVHGSEIPFVLAYRKILRRSDNTSETVFEDSPCLFFSTIAQQFSTKRIQAFNGQFFCGKIFKIWKNVRIQHVSVFYVCGSF